MGSLENSFTSAAEADEEDEEDDGGMEIGCWAKQVELNQISPSSDEHESTPPSQLSQVQSPYDYDDATPPSPLSQVQSHSPYDFDTTPPSPLSQSHTPYDFDDYKIGGPSSSGGARGEMERRWSGSTAHEEVPAPGCGGRAEERRQGAIESGRMRGLGVGALGALLDGVVEERVFFSIEDFPRSGFGEEGRRRVGMAM